jgi:hypothetical protein
MTATPLRAAEGGKQTVDEIVDDPRRRQLTDYLFFGTHSVASGSDQPLRTEAPPDRARQQKRRSPEQDCPRTSSLQGIQETACSAGDPRPQ